MQFARLRLALPLIVCGLTAGDATEVQETGAEGVFYGRGLAQGGRAGERLAHACPQRHHRLHAGDGDDVPRSRARSEP